MKPKMRLELFTESIEALEKQSLHDNKCAEAFKTILPHDFVSQYNNSYISEQLIKLLKVSLSDNHRDSWIEYYIYELDFGKKYKKGCATNADGSEINLSTAKDLYDFLVTKK